MLYGFETWPLRVEDQRCLEVFDDDCLRRILGRHRPARFTVPSFAVNPIFELGLRCFFGVDFVGLGMQRDVLSAKSYARSSIPNPQFTDVRSVLANSKRG